MARKKLIVEGIEAIEAYPASDDGGIAHCPHCGKRDGQVQTHSIIQYGFVQDKCSEIYRCQYCQGYGIVNYVCDVWITSSGLSYDKGEENGN